MRCPIHESVDKQRPTGTDHISKTELPAFVSDEDPPGPRLFPVVAIGGLAAAGAASTVGLDGREVSVVGFVAALVLLLLGVIFGGWLGAGKTPRRPTYAPLAGCEPRVEREERR